MNAIPNIPSTDFVDFLEGIPAEEWCAGYYVDMEGRRCGTSHVATQNGVAQSFLDLAENKIGMIVKFTGANIPSDLQHIEAVNDGDGPWRRLGDNPKTRVLTFLRSDLEQLSHILADAA